MNLILTACFAFFLYLQGSQAQKPNGDARHIVSRPPPPLITSPSLPSPSTSLPSSSTHPTAPATPDPATAILTSAISTVTSSTSNTLPSATDSFSNRSLPTGKTNTSSDNVNSRILTNDTNSNASGSGAPASNSSNTSPGESPTAGMIAGIVIGVLLAVLVAVFVIYQCLKHRQAVHDLDGSFDTEKSTLPLFKQVSCNQKVIPMEYNTSELSPSPTINRDALEHILQSMISKIQQNTVGNHPPLTVKASVSSILSQVEDPKDPPATSIDDVASINQSRVITSSSTQIGSLQKSVNPSSSSEPPEIDKLFPGVNLSDVTLKKAAEQVHSSSSDPHYTSHLPGANCNNSWTLSDQMMSPPAGDPFSIKTYSWGSNSGALDSSDISEDTCLPFSSVSTVGSILSPGSTFVVGKRLKYSSLLPVMAQNTSKHAPLDLWVGETVQIVQDLQNGLLVARTPNGHVGIMPTDVLVKW